MKTTSRLTPAVRLLRGWAMFAFIGGFSAESAAGYLVSGLAVGGGFLAGYFLGGAGAFVLDRWLFRKKTPPGVKKVARVLTGLAVAVLVALLVFGKGGAPGFGGGAGDGSKGEPKPSAKDAGEPKVPPKAPVPTRKGSDVRPGERVVRVTVLGGEDVRGGRFYLFDGDDTPRTFEDARSVLTEKKSADAGTKPALLIVFPARNAVARQHPAVTRLEAAAEALGYRHAGYEP